MPYSGQKEKRVEKRQKRGQKRGQRTEERTEDREEDRREEDRREEDRREEDRREIHKENNNEMCRRGQIARGFSSAPSEHKAAIQDEFKKQASTFDSLWHRRNSTQV